MKLSNSLSLYTVGICVAVFAAISVLLETGLSKRAEIRARYVTELLQSHMTHDIERDLAEAEVSARRSAMEISELPSPFERKEVERILGNMISSDSMIMGGSVAKVGGAEWMEYVRETRNGIETAQLGGSGYNYTAREWYTLPLREGKAVWCQPYSEPEAENTVMTTYSIPLKNASGVTTAIVTADVSLREITEEADSLRPYRASSTLLFNREGRLVDPTDTIHLAGNFKDARLLLARLSRAVTQTADFEGNMDLNGQSYTVCFSRVEPLDMTICTVTPRQVIISKFTAMRLPLIIIMLLGLLFLLTGVRYTVKRLTRPLDRLTSAARSIGKGDFHTPLPAGNSHSDIDRLRDAMSGMQTSIQGYMKRTADDAARMARIEGELDIARRIQQGMLPSPWPEEGIACGEVGIRVGASLEAARRVSGDLYDHLMVDGRFYFMIGDVSDKGVPASLVMASAINVFRFGARQLMGPSALMANINDLLCEHNAQNMFITAIIGEYDPQTAILTLANAGHNPPVVARGPYADYLKLPAGLPAGIMEGFEYPETEIPFSEGDSILLYTDGLTEAEKPHEANNSIPEQYGEKRLLSAFRALRNDNISPQSLTDRLGREVKDFADGKLSDDLTILYISLSMLKNEGIKELKREEDRPPLVMEVGYEISELAGVARMLSMEGMMAGWSRETLQRVNLLLEEGLANVISYSRPSVEGERIRVEVATSSGFVTVTISDSGERFNPLEQEAPDITADAEERKVGGLGIFLIREMASRTEYDYIDNHNILKIKISRI